ncbi:MAG: serine hydrolase [Planctomycetes bacterium]|nr:serine hydrolase [Planctomycetota bacterium]
MRRSPLLGLMLAACVAAPDTDPPRFGAFLADLRAYTSRQQVEMGVPGIWIAVLEVDPVTGEEHVWCDAVGGAVNSAVGSSLAERWNDLDPLATHRVASISKLYTDTAAMVLVERGQLDLDAPVRRYLPDFAPHDPFGAEITLRHLMGHRAGLVRESPVGHYFDPSEPSLQATVASLNDTALVFAPGSDFKYSNPGIGVVGEVVARVSGMQFCDAVRELVLLPLGLTDSDFAARPDLMARQADGIMWTYDGRDIPTPSFRFGYTPAAELRSTTVDLVRFARSWFPDATRRVLQPATQAAMWQLREGQRQGCGLGFFVGDLDGHRRVGHGGAVYGFASSLMALPDDGVAVAVICTKDFANEVSEAIAERALRSVLLNRDGLCPTPAEFPSPVGAVAARAQAGHYRVGEDWVELLARGDELYYDPNIGVRTRLRRAGDGSLVADDPLGLGASRRLVRQADGRWWDGVAVYERDDAVPAEVPTELRELIGEYGWDHDVLVVYEDHGQLAVLIEWVVRYLPVREAEDHYRFPSGMYNDDLLVFERDAAGRVTAAVVGGARFARRPDPETKFRIVPTGPVPELVAAARDAVPPPQPATLLPSDLVELAVLDPTLRFDLRYAGEDNFMGHRFYDKAVAKMQRPAAEALARVHQQLAKRGLGLLVFDAYRPWAVTKAFWEATPDAQKDFVADPSKGSRHNRGCAVDLTLCDLATGQPVEMPSTFDEFTVRAYPDWPGGTSRQRYWRELLRRSMEGEGFTVYEKEWWHFDFAGWEKYAVANDPL